MKILGTLNYDDFHLKASGKSLRLIELNAPEKLNALSRDNWANLKQLSEEAASANAALLITSARQANRDAPGKHKPPAFCSGFDLEELYTASQSIEEFKKSIEMLHLAYFALLRHPYPVIVVADGLAYGGGCGLALCGDFIAATPETQISFPTDPRLKAVAHVVEPFVQRRLGKGFSWEGTGINVNKALEKGLIDMVLERRPTKEEFVEFADSILSDVAYANFDPSKSRRPFDQAAANAARAEVVAPEVFGPAAKYLTERHNERIERRKAAARATTTTTVPSSTSPSIGG